MLAFLARVAGGAVAPLVDRVSAFGASLARKLVLFLVAGVCFLVVLAALTIAFDLWIAMLAGPIAGALAVAGVYLAVGLLAVTLAMRGDRSAQGRVKAGARAEEESQGDEAAAGGTTRNAQIDRFIAPILGMLQNLGLRREQLAVLAGASMAKQLRPLPLVGVAIVAGFLVGRVWKGRDVLLSTELVTTLLGMLGLSQSAREAAETTDQAT